MINISQNVSLTHTDCSYYSLCQLSQQKHVIFIFQGLIYFTKNNSFHVDPFHCKPPGSILFYGSVAFHKAFVPHFIFSIIRLWVSWMVSYLFSYELSCYKHKSTDNSITTACFYQEVSDLQTSCRIVPAFPLVMDDIRSYYQMLMHLELIFV